MRNKKDAMVKIVAEGTSLLVVVLVLAALSYWYIGEPVSYAKVEQLDYCTNKQSVTELLGTPTSISHGYGKEYWEYHGSFLGIQTVIHLDVIFTNDMYCGWAKMD